MARTFNKDSFPRQVRPMLAHPGKTPFTDPGWLVEPKLDGFRLLAFKDKEEVRLLSRNGHDFTGLFKPIASSLLAAGGSVVLDGEAVMLDCEGRPTFDALQALLEPRARPGSVPGLLVYIAFDCLYADSRSLMGYPLDERRTILSSIAPSATDRLRVIAAFSGTEANVLFEKAIEFGLEGVVLKRRASLYQPGKRSRDWIKIPVRRREDFVIGGYIAGAAGLGSLVVGQYSGRRLVYAGLVGTGFSGHERASLASLLLPLRRQRCPFSPLPKIKDPFGETRVELAEWVKPEIVVEVEFTHRSMNGLRHASFKRVRLDKLPHEVKASFE